MTPKERVKELIRARGDEFYENDIESVVDAIRVEGDAKPIPGTLVASSMHEDCPTPRFKSTSSKWGSDLVCPMGLLPYATSAAPAAGDFDEETPFSENAAEDFAEFWDSLSLADARVVINYIWPDLEVKDAAPESNPTNQ